MEHLTHETLARLVDETPGADERRHLEACDACARELRELRLQTEALSGLPDLRPPAGDWAVLEARMVSEGLVDGGGRVRSLARTPGWMKAAAAVLLFLSGTGVGAAAGAGTLPGASGSPVADASGPFALASEGFSTVDQAEEAVRAAERQYMDAWVRYRQMVEADGGGALPDPATRIAALEYLVRAGQAALREAPADPFLNGLVASAVAEREATIRQASSASGESWY